jgi:hypothetical protein
LLEDIAVGGSVIGFRRLVRRCLSHHYLLRQLASCYSRCDIEAVSLWAIGALVSLH